jgi:cytochrome c oxidase assembly protein Cox11
VRSLREFNGKFFCSKGRYNGTPGRVLRRCSIENRKSENATNMSFVSNEVDWVRSLREFNGNFFCSKGRYNGTPGRVLRRCSIENRNSENAIKMSFGSNGVDWVRSLRKIQQHDFLFENSL